MKHSTAGKTGSSSQDLGVCGAIDYDTKGTDHLSDWTIIRTSIS